MDAWIWIALSVYFLPTFISLLNKKSKTLPIFIINLVLGWTVLMWISMLFESFYDTEKSKSRSGFIEGEETNVLNQEVKNKKRRIWTVDYVLDAIHWQKFIK